MYSLADFGDMLADPIRRQAYVAALQESIDPGSVVLEIGTGPGVFALLAARLGARKVYALEPGDAIVIARQIVAANDLGDRVELVQRHSTEVELPERVDVVVSDLRGILPLFGDHLSSIIDVRERLLAPGGRLVPQADSLWASVVTAEETWGGLTAGWCDNDLGFDLGIPLGHVINSWKRARFKADQCLVEPRRWAVIDYRKVADPNVAGKLRWQLSRPGRAHGVAVWFDARLSAGAGFSNAPGSEELIYGQAFFPFPRPVELREGDRLDVELEATRMGNDYVWRWTTAIENGSGEITRFAQSTFYASPLSLSRLRKRAASYVPELGEEGRIELFILERMDGGTTLEVIARQLRSAFPSRFSSWRDALAQVADLAQRLT